MYGAILIFFVSNVLRVREFIPATNLTNDLEIQGHMILHMPDLTRLLHSIATNLGLFLMLYGSGNSFQLLPNAWP